MHDFGRGIKFASSPMMNGETIGRCTNDLLTKSMVADLPKTEGNVALAYLLRIASINVEDDIKFYWDARIRHY